MSNTKKFSSAAFTGGVNRAGPSTADTIAAAAERKGGLPGRFRASAGRRRGDMRQLLPTAGFAAAMQPPIVCRVPTWRVRDGLRACFSYLACAALARRPPRVGRG